ncbi:MAG TPA: hypothetical protein VFB79_15375 [Candidatus Angelobacter sp.]|nr:hypothetical protein [Candidatus Angelobacter sp.]
MRIQLNQNLVAKKPRHGRRMQPSAIQTAFLFLLLLITLAGCGGKSSTNNTVSQVNVSPASVSLVAGQVVQINASAVNATNTPVTTTFTFNSSNTSVASISPAGLVCGGVWDTNFVVCNGNDTSGNPISGTATLTVTAQGITSGPVSVSVHPSVTSVSVDAPSAGCFSVLQTHQFVAHAFHNQTEITSTVGNITWAPSAGAVVTIDANGLATARVPGISGVVASVGTTTSPAVFFKTCMPAQLILHGAGDPANGFTFSNTMNVSDTKQVQVDMIDENGVVVSPAPVTIFTDNSTVATLVGTTVTAQSPGGAGLTASCAPPTCGIGLNTPVYSNLYSIFVNGTSPVTNTIYVASSFPVPTGTIMPLIPIDASKNPPVAGAAIPLPGVPNSIVFDRAGDKAYIGTNIGLAILTTASNTVALATPVPIGKVLAVSPDGTQVIISNSANDPSTNAPIDGNASEQRVWVFNQSTNTITTFVLPGAVAASFDEDGFRAYIGATNGNVYVFSNLLTLVTENIGGSNSSVASLPSGPFAYVANSAGLQTIATCNNVQQTAALNTPTQLVGTARNSDLVVAVTATGVDILTPSIARLGVPLNLTAANCAPGISYSNQVVDYGLGAFTANQLLVASTGSHIAILPANINKVLTAVPGVGGGFATLPTGATQAFNGGMTPDGNTLWVGVGGTNTVDRINLQDNIDEVQVPTTFQKVDGSAAPPNIVAVQPK